MVKKSNTEAFFATISGALTLYSSDFSGYYPPDIMDGNPVSIRTGSQLQNSSQVLCYYLESTAWTDCGSRKDYYHTFGVSEKKKQGEGTSFGNVVFHAGMKGHVSEDYITDLWGGPVMYDERKSSGTRDGLNPHTFVLVSGSGRDKNPAIAAPDFEQGNGIWPSVFSAAEAGTVDTLPSDYDHSIPKETDLNDDIYNR
jgi:hypothetical protein